MLLCVLGPGGQGGEVGITPLYGLSEVWVAPKGVAFGLFMCEKGVNFIHTGLIKGMFFTLAWYWVLNSHINSICQSIYHHLHNIRRIRKYLSYDNRKSIVQAIIMSRLGYCNGLLYGTPAVHLKLAGKQVSCNACRTRQLGSYVLYPGMIISHHP